jgi:hypothetical protein
MRSMAAMAAVLTLLTPSVYAETNGPVNSSQMDAASSSNDQTSPNAPAENNGGTQGAAAAQKIQQDLQNAGFTDVKVVAESFVVQAKSRDGNPVLMTIGPNGMSVFEAMSANGPSSGTVGEGSGAGTSASPNVASPSSQPSAPQQR